jgi:putative FmdB family regulatory protein
MAQYNYFCRACKKEFSKILTISEYEKGKNVCPHCKSKDVKRRWAAFYEVTLKKS